MPLDYGTSKQIVAAIKTRRVAVTHVEIFTPVHASNGEFDGEEVNDVNGVIPGEDGNI